MQSESIAYSQIKKRIYSQFAKEIEYSRWNRDTDSELMENLRKNGFIINSWKRYRI